jgi:hypothetical protein
MAFHSSPIRSRPLASVRVLLDDFLGMRLMIL